MNPNLVMRRIEEVRDRYGTSAFCYMDVSANKIRGRSFLIFKDVNGKVVECCSEHDDDFIKMFGKPLFNSEAYMSNSVRKHVKQFLLKLQTQVMVLF